MPPNSTVFRPFRGFLRTYILQASLWVRFSGPETEASECCAVQVQQQDAVF
jgi:hypothetical protein